jgi:nucleoside-diphosphate-sugar epimerase
MLSGEKILVTGPAGQIAFPLARYLAADNEVWGISRFGDDAVRHRVESAGIITRSIDLAGGEFGDLPADFTYVLHLATYRQGGLDYDQAIRVNAEGTHLLLEHCRKAKAALVMSTFEAYQPQHDPWHAYSESDPLGDSHSLFDPTYSVSKIAQEAVARSCARVLDLPVVIPRMNASYGPNGGLLAYHLDWIRAGSPVKVKWDPANYSPIHQDDINAQVEAMLHAATVPATVVNWCGDEPVSAQQWCAYLAELTGRPADVQVNEVAGGIRGIIGDTSLRRTLTGPCAVGWREGLERLVTERPDPSDRTSGDAAAARLLRSFGDE